MGWGGVSCGEDWICASVWGGGAQVVVSVLGTWFLVLEEEGEFGIRVSAPAHRDLRSASRFGIAEMGMAAGSCQVQRSPVLVDVTCRVFLARSAVLQAPLAWLAR